MSSVFPLVPKSVTACILLNILILQKEVLITRSAGAVVKMICSELTMGCRIGQLTANVEDRPQRKILKENEEGTCVYTG